MTPAELADIEARLRTVEQGEAVLRSQLADVSSDVAELAPLIIEVTKLRGSVSGLSRTVDGFRADLGKVGASLENRDKAATDERKALKVALVGLTGTIFTSVAGGLIAYLTTLH